MNVNLETGELEGHSDNLADLEKLKKEVERLTAIIYKSHKAHHRRETNSKKDVVIEEVKKWECGVPLPDFAGIIKKAGYMNTKAGSIYFRKGRGLLVMGALPTGERRVFFNPNKMKEIAHA